MMNYSTYVSLLVTLCCLIQVEGFEGYVTLTSDGPCVKGGRITFRADLFMSNGQRPSGTFSYRWRDNGIYPHEFETDDTSNTTTYWVVDFPADLYPVGPYEVEITVKKKFFLMWPEITSRRLDFEITALLNGNMSIVQGNKTLTNSFVTTDVNTKIAIELHKGDDFYIKHNTNGTLTYWFVDCKYYGMTEDFTFDYKFAKQNETHIIEALIIAPHNQPVVSTTVSPRPVNKDEAVSEATTTTTTTTNNSSVSMAVPYVASSPVEATTTSSIRNSTDLISSANRTDLPLGNLTFPYVCLNSSIIAPDPNKTYGYFYREVHVRAPISNITVEGTNWIQPWDMLSLKVACQGTGPFHKCLEFHRGEYNVTGHEKCEEGVHLPTCNFSILHYFLEPSVYTILVILENDVSTQIYPLTINIYKISTKPQLSVIVVPVSCSLAAVVLIIFGVAYYIQSKARFTVEVADFDFGQNNPEMEYKTFTERLRDSFNNTGYKQLSNPKTAQWRDPSEPSTAEIDQRQS